MAKQYLLDSDTLGAQAIIISRYLVAQEPSVEIITRYEHIMTQAAVSLTKTDKKMFQIIHKHPWALAYLDAYTAIFQPLSELRHRIFVVFAILESEPGYAALFLTENRPLTNFISFLIAGTRACFRLVIGCLLYKLVWRIA